MAQAMMHRFREDVTLWGVSKHTQGILEPPTPSCQGLHLAGVRSLGIDWLVDSLSNYPPSFCWLLTKGLRVEEDTLCTLPEYLRSRLPQWSFGMIAGPALASDITCRERLIALTFAYADEEGRIASKNIIEFLDTSFIKVTESGHMQSICYFAAFKNLYAIIIGFSYYYGPSARATVLTAVCQELRILCTVLGIDSRGIYDYAGLGDILLTGCSGRNAQFGFHLAQGMFPEQILSGPMDGQAVEGYVLSRQLLGNKKFTESIQQHSLPLITWVLEAFAKNNLPAYSHLINAVYSLQTSNFYQ